FFRFVVDLGAEGRSDKGNLTQYRNFADARVGPVLDQPADCQRLVILHHDRGAHALDGTAGHNTARAGDGSTRGRIEIADFRLYFQIDFAVAQNDGQEVDRGAERLKADAGCSTDAGDVGHGLVAAIHERSGPPAQGHDARLGQQLGQVFVLQGLKER